MKVPLPEIQVRHRLTALITAFTASTAFTAFTAQAQSRDPRLAQIARAPSARRIESDIRTLVGFGTRHTLSDTLSQSRGIGAARRWIKSQFDSISAACGNCLDVQFVGGMVGPTQRIPTPTNVVSVV